jgi:hypothetical protein
LEEAMNTFQRATIAAAVPTLLILGAAVPALASGGSGGGGGGGNGVRSSGPCATGSFELKAKHDDGRLEVEAEVDTNRVGQVWAWRLSDNGTQFASGRSTTAAPSGSFSVRRTTANRPGADVIRLTATRGAVTCGGAVTLP